MTIFSSVYAHFTFSTKNLQPLIGEEWRSLLEEYLALKIRREKELPIAISVMADHVHLMVKLGPYKTLDGFMHSIKTSSQKFINDYQFSEVHFEWEEEYSSFTFGMGDVDTMIKFVDMQKHYHLNKTYHEELQDILDQLETPYEEKDLDRWKSN